mgnify:CR=1 FL=1
MRSYIFQVVLFSFIFYTPNYSRADSSSVNSDVLIDNDAQITYQEKQTSFKENLEKYEDAIEELESAQGAYAAPISQQLIGLANIYEENEKYYKAVEVLKRSIHVNKINEGLYSSSQIPIVFQLISNLKKSKQWLLVKKNYHYLYQIYRRNYGDHDFEKLDFELTLAKWYLKSFLSNFSDKPIEDLVNSQTAYFRAANLIALQFGDTDIQLVQAFNGLMVTQHLLTNPVSPKNSRSIAYDSSSSFIPGMQRTSYKTGKFLIEREYEILKKQTDTTDAILIQNRLKLADWYLVYNKKHSAIEQYRNTYQYALKQTNFTPEIESLFTQPISLPNLPYLDRITSSHLDDIRVEDRANYTRVSIDVTRNGDARNIEVTDEANKDNVTKRIKISRYLRNTKFRPKLINGAPVETKKLPLYVLTR